MEVETIKKSQRETTLELEDLGKRSGVIDASITNRIQEREEKKKLSCISLRELFMSFLKSSIIIMRSDFRSEYCFSGVLGYLDLVVGELVSVDAM